MAKCPLCKAEIDHLLNWCQPYREIQVYKFNITPQGQADYQPVEKRYFQDEWDVYECPECGAELFYSAESAFNFLGGAGDTR